MSITFYPVRFDNETQRWEHIYHCDCLDYDGEPPFPSCEICRDIHINLCNRNALDLLQWVGVEVDYCGMVAAKELAARCRRRLWDEPRNYDEGLPTIIEHCAVEFGREAGYLRRQTERLLFVAEKAGDHHVSWG